MTRKRYALFIAGFFMSIHFALPAYINSTFLSEFMSERIVGLTYTVGSILAILGLIYAPKTLSLIGNFKLSIIGILISAISFVGLALTQNPLFIFILAVISLIFGRLIPFNNDIFLENISTDNQTGGIRGFYLTATNFAWVVSPIVGAFILGNDNYSRLYLVTAAVAIVMIFILFGNFKNFKDPEYDHKPFWKTLKEVSRNKDIRRVMMTNILLRFFYSWMVIYTPIYLHQHVGFEWSEIGLIFTIMLLPFILLEAPLGKIADRYLGERELMIAGFLIISGSTMYLSFIVEPSIVLWAIALFVTRIGAAILEIMGDTYFFKKIDGGDSNLLSFFRITGPLAYVIGPLVATILLSFIDIKYLFLILGIIMLYGLKYSYNLKDTL